MERLIGETSSPHSVRHARFFPQFGSLLTRENKRRHEHPQSYRSFWNHQNPLQLVLGNLFDIEYLHTEVQELVDLDQLSEKTKQLKLRNESLWRITIKKIWVPRDLVAVLSRFSPSFCLNSSSLSFWLGLRCEPRFLFCID